MSYIEETKIRRDQSDIAVLKNISTFVFLADKKIYTFLKRNIPSTFNNKTICSR
jgi:hypothetical protein